MRIVKHAIGALCLLAALVLVVLWVRSYWVADQLRRTSYADEGNLYVRRYEVWQLYRGQVRWQSTQIGWPLDGRLPVDREQIRKQTGPEKPLSYLHFRTDARSPQGPWHGFEYKRWGSRVSDGYLAQWGHSIAIPIWLPVLLLAIPSGLWLRGLFRRQNPHACPGCGYDLRASPERCPECGRSVTPPAEAGGATDFTDSED